MTAIPSASGSAAEQDLDPARTGRRPFVSPYLLLLVADMACRGLRFLADIVLVRHFSRDVIGQLNLAHSLAIQGIGLSSWGLDIAGTRSVAAGACPAPAMATTVMLLRLVLGVVAWGGVALVALAVPKYQPVVQYAVWYGLSILTGALTIGWVAQALQRMHVVAVAMLATNLAFFGGVQLVTHAGWSPRAVPLVLAGAEGAIAVALWIWLLWSQGEWSRGLPLPAAWGFFRSSMPIGAANYLRMLTNGSDILLLGLFVSDGDVGLYSTGFKLYSLGGSLIAIYLGVLLPQLAAVTGGEPLVQRTLLFTALRRALLATLVVLPLAEYLAGDVIQLLFGAPFSGAAPALRILFCAWPIQILSGHFRTALVAQGRVRQDLGLVALATLVHLVAKVGLIPWLGNLGASWGTLAGEAACLWLAWRCWRAAGRDAQG